MKKILSLVTVVLLVAALSVSAFAASYVPSAEKKASFKVISAAIVNANGTIVADATDDVAVVLYQNKDAASSSVKAALEAAYDDLAGAADLKDLAADLTVSVKNAAILWLFDLTVSGDAADYLALDGYSLKVEVASDDVMLVLHKAASGWEKVANVACGNGKVTFTVDSASPFAFVSDGEVTDIKPATEVTSPDTSDFVPSAEKKASFKFVSAKIINANGTVVADATDDVAAVLYQNKDKASSAVKAALDAAYDELANAKDLKDLAANLNVSVKNAAILELFDLAVSGDAADYLALDGYYLQVEVNCDDVMLVLHKAASGWEKVAEVTSYGNTVVFTVDSASPFALVSDGEVTDIQPVADVTSPDTSSTVSVISVAAAVMFGLAAAFFFTKKTNG